MNRQERAELISNAARAKAEREQLAKHAQVRRVQRQREYCADAIAWIKAITAVNLRRGVQV